VSRSLAEELQDLRSSLMRANEHEGAEQVLDLLMAVTSADETYAALTRSDVDAVAFHTELLSRHLAVLDTLDFHVEYRHR
jgi:hypothetical protein